MRVIESYSDYLIAVRDQTSDIRYVRTEAINALQNLRNSKPEKYAEYKARQEEAKKPKPRSAQGRAYDKAKYIQEHPEIDVEELRRKARTSLIRRPYGLGLGTFLPNWITEDEVMNSVEQLTISDLITSSGKFISRDTLIKRCIKCAVFDRRIDENKLRQIISSQFTSYYNNKTIALRNPNLFIPIKRFLINEATVDELANVTDGTSLDFDKFFRLINSKDIKELSDDEIKRLNNNQTEHKSKNARKREMRRAEKAAKLKAASDKRFEEYRKQLRIS